MKEVDGVENLVTVMVDTVHSMMDIFQHQYTLKDDTIELNMSEDMPEDLSVKYRSVAVQTETAFQDKLEAIFEELSQNQIKYFLDALLTLVSKEDNKCIDQKQEYYKDVFKQVTLHMNRHAKGWSKAWRLGGGVIMVILIVQFFMINTI